MKYKIANVMIYYENLQVKVGRKWYYIKLDKLKGITIKGKIVKKKTRTWIE